MEIEVGLNIFEIPDHSRYRVASSVIRFVFSLSSEIDRWCLCCLKAERCLSFRFGNSRREKQKLENSPKKISITFFAKKFNDF